MAVISKAEAEAVLEPHKSKFIECWTRAWTKWVELAEKVPDTRVALRARAQANNLYDLMCRELKLCFDGVPGVTWSEKGGFLTLNFEDKILLRFKKVDEDYRSHNIQTRQQELFQLQVELPGFPSEPTRAVLGYQPDRLQQRIPNIVVTCHTGKTLEWVLPIIAPPASAEGVVLIPMDPDMPQPTIRRKKTREEKQQENEQVQQESEEIR